MAKQNKKLLTEKEQRVAVDILTEYIISHSDNGFNSDFLDWMMKQYDLCYDPFTTLPCTPKEYAKNSMEYRRQSMLQKYGHCDGLD